MLTNIETDQAPKAIGPYSQGIILPKGKQILFVSGQLPVDPKTGQLISEDIFRQTTQVINNIEAILIKGKTRLDNVLRLDVFLTSLKDHYQSVNEVFEKHFVHFPRPARQTIEVKNLPMNAPIEISCIAFVEP